MNSTTHSIAERITVVDALRGFALVSIMLLHNIERFEVYGFQAELPSWIMTIDGYIWDSFFFVFGGKSYAIFALLFGLTFYIQSNNSKTKGGSFKTRFLWRMILLIGFGLVNTLFYQGEILVMYALVGMVLIPFENVSDKILLAAALFFLFQPIMWAMTILAMSLPADTTVEPSFIYYYELVGNNLMGDSMFSLMKSNITNGRMASLFWFWENGRVDQTFGLFLMGIWAGRRGVFNPTTSNLKFWKTTLIFSFISLNPLLITKNHFLAGTFSNSLSVSHYLGTIFGLWFNLALMLVLVSGFVLLFYNSKCQSTLNKLSPIGKMSLTNYVLQSIVGSTLYYGFGFGIYQYVGATYGLMIGIVLALLMGYFSHTWMKNHRRGILENLWHRLTYLIK